MGIVPPLTMMCGQRLSTATPAIGPSAANHAASSEHGRETLIAVRLRDR